MPLRFEECRLFDANKNLFVKLVMSALAKSAVNIDHIHHFGFFFSFSFLSRMFPLLVFKVRMRSPILDVAFF